MNIYERKQWWKILLAVVAGMIVLISLWYTNMLVNKIKAEERLKAKLWADAIQKKVDLVQATDSIFQQITLEEREKVELVAEAIRELSVDTLSMDVDSKQMFMLKVVTSNKTIPFILTDEQGNIKSFRNLDKKKSKDPEWLKAQIDTMRMQHDPIENSYTRDRKNYVYYRDSRLFSDLKYVFNRMVNSFIGDVATNSASVPVIYTDSTQNRVIAHGNLDTSKLGDSTYVKNLMKEMASENKPLEISLGNEKNYIFYSDSYVLKQLRYYPYVQFGMTGIFILVAYIFFSTARKVEQNQVWIGMAKETAHQLGTPLSSLIAWVEYLKSKGADPAIISDMEQDVKRLETITERFSKIGSVPKLDRENIISVVTSSVDYMRTRTSKNVTFTINSKNPEIFVPVNVPLFAWVIENLCRNAADAMTGSGSITIDIEDHTQFVYIDVTDTGKGIPKSNYKTVFEPGFTTKKRGWGLGLSLSKRIIEIYHRGKIFVKRSEMDKGTTFRIVLQK